jgi:hypothetical protein
MQISVLYGIRQFKGKILPRWHWYEAVFNWYKPGPLIIQGPDVCRKQTVLLRCFWCSAWLMSAWPMCEAASTTVSKKRLS